MKEVNYDRIIVSDNYGQLTGIGLEYIVIKDEVVAKFCNGNLITQVISPDEEITKAS